ncbi:MAG: endolytic transglycosylase MltG [Bacteroidaceae bacterium]|nr:endolytic transglycosylase MltG [Bacteroidaceae bacterium]
MTRTHKLIAYGLGAAVLVLTGVAAWLYLAVCSPVCHGKEAVVLVDDDDSMDSVRVKLSANTVGWGILSSQLPMNLRTGRYVFAPGTKLLSAYRRIRNHVQDPVRLVVPQVRLLSQLAARLSPTLMIDSARIASAMADERLIDSLGFDRATLPAMFIPNTYEVWWDTSARDLMLRLHREWRTWWTDERQSKAREAGLTPIEVATLASIVDSETANNAEKPAIAGLYINRLRRGIPLQADPTVVFALQDFTIRRVLHTHLQTDSPYNTYRNEGLPPGPIRIASIAGLEAVLNYQHHDYIYMCAKEDFSGTHNFAASLPEHYANARRYAKALNARGIK